MELKYTGNHTLGQIIHYGKWIIPECWERLYPIIEEEIQTSELENDELIWEGSANGEITVKDVYNFYREKGTITQWHGRIWRPFIPPKCSIFAWKVLPDRVVTAAVLYRRGLFRL